MDTLNTLAFEDEKMLRYKTITLKRDASSSSIPSSPDSGSQIDAPGLPEPELPPMDRGFNAWLFCVCSFVAEMCMWGFLSSYGMFQGYYTTHPPFNTTSEVAIAAVDTVGFGIQYGEVLFLCIMFRRYPEYVRPAIFSSLVVYFACLFGSSFATKVWQLILLQGVGVGFSTGIAYLPVMILLPQWFSERRGLAGGIIFAGCGVGGFVFPFMTTALLNSVGLRWTLRVWAIMTSVLTGIAFLGIRPRIPVVKPRRGEKRPPFLVPQLKYFKTPLFLSFSFTCLLQGLSYFAVSLYLAPFAQKVSSPVTATIALALFNSASVVGQVMLGYLTDRFAYPWIMLFSAVGSGLSVFLLWGFAQGPALIYPFAIIFGTLSGGFSAVWPNAVVDCADGKPEDQDITYAGTAAFKAVSAVVGPILSGILLDAGKSSSLAPHYGLGGYGTVVIFVGSTALATGFGSIAVAAARRRAPLS